MRHMVFMKLAPGSFDERAERDYVETFGELRRALPGDILSCRVLRNSVERAQNMDVLIEMTLAGPESLPRYLSHPLHRAIGERYAADIVSLASFDCEE